MRHECSVQGVESKCHICEDIACGEDLGSTCNYQLQGVYQAEIDWHMSMNVPTVSDVPFAVGGDHRYDFGNPATSHMCLMTSGGDCTMPVGVDDFTDCSVRCWGYGFDGSDTVKTEFEDADGLRGATDRWDYPKVDASQGTTEMGAPAFLPQGQVGTLAGSGLAGYVDGPALSARFDNPQDVAVDAEGNVFVVDTFNHVVRVVEASTGEVRTVAGSGEAGYEDGLASEAQFSHPSGIAVYYDWSTPGVWGDLVLFVADTDNHRIRKISGAMDGTGTVSCFSGRCGNGTSSFTLTQSEATPQPGYADGDGSVARFDSPKGVAVTDDGLLFVADTNNHLVRWLYPNGTANTLAGNLDIAERDEAGEPRAGCLPPCLKGVEGHRDGNLTFARFSYPSDVAVGANSTVLVTDKHSLRRVTPQWVDIGPPFPYTDFAWSVIQGISSDARVVTLAGQLVAGEKDGYGQEAEFNGPAGVTMSADGTVYVVDSVSCRLRRIRSAEQVAVPVTCATRVDEVVRPSGCSSYDPPVGDRDKKATPAAGNVYYNYDYREVKDIEDGEEYVGRHVKDCQGVPPLDELQKEFEFVTGENLVVDDQLVDVNEDTDDGTTIKVWCPPECTPATDAVADANVRGGGPGEFYTDDSSVCQAAVHAGAIADPSLGGLVSVTLQRGTLARNATAGLGRVANGVGSGDVPSEWRRLFGVENYPVASVEVQTTAGAPAALLEQYCGFLDAQPPQEALFNVPSGVSMHVNSTLNDTTLLYIADTNNNRIRSVTAVCSKVCENGGRCVGSDTCACASGWEGDDCTVPACSSAPGDRQLCLGPDTLGCIPGYTNFPDCDTPQCVQECNHGGVCSAPDTCTCAYGWFDSNCTTPVCTQTCGNGANCTAPDTCTCADDWQGHDCRIPVCDQTCENSGWCTAPNTCQCPPQWSGHDCSLPVCTQGFFLPDPSEYLGGQDTPRLWEMYMPCNVENWCNATNGFDCDQRDREFFPLQIQSGPDWRPVTGRKNVPNRCDMIELGEDVVSQYQYLQADNSTTRYARYTPKTPYDWDADPKHPWSAYDAPYLGKTQPWNWYMDREVAFVEWMNVTQGAYVCANGGNCTAPDVCECADGWIGFDCRVPVCTQGYYSDDQTNFVTGTMKQDEVLNFEAYLDQDQNYRLGADGIRKYSNPNYTEVHEWFTDKTDFVRNVTHHGGVRYLAKRDPYAPGEELQGGYYCSVRSVTDWENMTYIFEHPNYYSRYMNEKIEFDGETYTYFRGMDWPYVHEKSYKKELNGRVLAGENSDDHSEWLDQFFYVYTDEGYKRDGDWFLTGNVAEVPYTRAAGSNIDGMDDLFGGLDAYDSQDNMMMHPYVPWQKGTCIMEFNRTCPGAPWKALDQEGGLSNRLVQDTDLSYRARIEYTDWTAIASGRWFQEDGECVDEVIRGCFNNGTCVAPDECRCAEGWTGQDCRIPICEQACNHHGNCTHPDTCTCERGWTGHDCGVAVCAQDCNNGGKCVAPDVCMCAQWPSSFRDGRDGGGRPVFRKPNGDPQNTGWTGYDCATPICVQAEEFVLNTNKYHDGPDYFDTKFRTLGGHGKDGTEPCDTVRCPQYDEMVTQNDGTSFQTGCGYDPRDTGCCHVTTDEASDVTYYRCSVFDYTLNQRDCEANNNDAFVYPGAGDGEGGEVCSKHGDLELVTATSTDGSQIYLTIEMSTIIEYNDRDHLIPDDIDAQFLDPATGYDDVLVCGDNHNPYPYYVDPNGDATFSSHNGDFNVTSDTYLCNVHRWEQGDYIDDLVMSGRASWLDGYRTDPGFWTQEDSSLWWQAIEEMFARCSSGESLADESCDGINDECWWCYYVKDWGNYVKKARPGDSAGERIEQMQALSGILSGCCELYPDAVNNPYDPSTCDDPFVADASCQQWDSSNFPCVGEPGEDLVAGYHLKFCCDGVVMDPDDHNGACQGAISGLYPGCPDCVGASLAGDNDCSDGCDCQTQPESCYIADRDPFGPNLEDYASAGDYEDEDYVFFDIESSSSGAFSEYYWQNQIEICLEKCGRHVRSNHPNITMVTLEEWVFGDPVRGEGVYECYNGGSCIAPDTCTCSDGWDGFDCNTPLCRHLQPSEQVTSCENGGICVNRDSCQCIQTDSVLYLEHESAVKGTTGWTGTDCTLPMCVQGFYDPFCTDLPQAPGGEGCYRCANGGNCTAPDFCECAEGWEGFDCTTPVCEAVANELTRAQLDTVDEEKVNNYEMEPCTLSLLYAPEDHEGVYYARGNCTKPNQCTCLCRAAYNPHDCHSKDEHCDGAWQDPLVKLRNVLGPTDIYGTRDCYVGYEGNLDEMDRYTSCHLSIYVPSSIERNSITIVSLVSCFSLVFTIAYFYIRRKLKQRYLLAKVERRRSRRSSEESITDTKKSAFGHN